MKGWIVSLLRVREDSLEVQDSPDWRADRWVTHTHTLLCPLIHLHPFPPPPVLFNAAYY